MGVTVIAHRFHYIFVIQYWPCWCLFGLDFRRLLSYDVDLSLHSHLPNNRLQHFSVQGEVGADGNGFVARVPLAALPGCVAAAAHHLGLHRRAKQTHAYPRRLGRGPS